MASIAPDRVRDVIRIDAANYTSRHFAAREAARLWPRAWQVACREEEVPKAGDYVTYDVANESIVVVRRGDGRLNAFHNVCPHRGRQIMQGCGHAVNLRCGYHNWTFDLEGRCVAVQDEEDWGDALDRDDLRLKAVQCDIWGGFVWINMDPAAENLAAWLGVVPDYLDPFELERMRIRWAWELHVDCNWKVALEAFMEAYHVAATHTQLLPVQGDDYTQSAVHGRHGHFGYWDSRASIGVPSPRLKRAAPADVRPGVVEFFRMMEETFGAIFTDRDCEAAKDIMEHLPPDADAMTAFGMAMQLGRAAADREGCGYPERLTVEAFVKAGTGWSIFPNNATLPYFDGAVWYRSRPDPADHEKCVFTIYSLKRYAEGREPGARPVEVTDLTGRSFGQIVDQDVANMRAVQRGMKSSAFAFARPNPKQELPIANFHRTLEAFLQEAG